MIFITINNLEFQIKSEISILEACKSIGIHIPRFCYHESLSVAGNCRMCVVEVDPLEKPVASCATDVEEDMNILVNSPFVLKARETILEMILLNHPLDCPICDQAGECDLQDQTKAFGAINSKYFFPKKSSLDEFRGPLISTIMTRCISCTRCVRYGDEAAGIVFFGTIERGNDMKITTYTPRLIDSEISGNVIDLCPVGALTSFPYKFKGRPWELVSTESIDTTDAFGSNIYVHWKENKIVRILPRINSDINQNVISDRARFLHDANENGRLAECYAFDSRVVVTSVRTELKSREELMDDILNHVFTNDPLYKQINEYTEVPAKYYKIDFNDLKLKLHSVFSENRLKNIYVDNNDMGIEGLLLLHFLKYTSKSNIRIFLTNSNTATTNFFSLMQIDLNIIDKYFYKSCLLLSTNFKQENPILNYRLRFENRLKNLTVKMMGPSSTTNISNMQNFISLPSIFNTLEGKLAITNKKDKIFLFWGYSLAIETKSLESVIHKLSFYTKHISSIPSYFNANSVGFKLFNIAGLKRSHENATDIWGNVQENFPTLNYMIKKNKLNIAINSHIISEVNNYSKFLIPCATPFEESKILINMLHIPQKTNGLKSTQANQKSLKDILIDIFDSSKLLNRNVDSLFKKQSMISHLIKIASKSLNNKIEVKIFNNGLETSIENYTGINKIVRKISKLKQKDSYFNSKLTVYSPTLYKASELTQQHFQNISFS